MNRPAALLLTAILLVGSVSALPAAVAAASTSLSASSTALQADANATDVTPGQRLAGVIGAGQAEFEGEVELRAYGIQYAMANSNASKAEVVEERLERVRERLQALEQREESLREARQNGSMSEGEYRARVTTLAAQGQQLEQQVNASETRARGLPDDVLAERGINVTEIRTLRAQAANLTGQEVAEIARSIAGPEVGRSVTGGPPANVSGPPADAPGDGDDDTNETTRSEAQASISQARLQVETAQEMLRQADQRIGANASDNATDAIEQAEAALERAQEALDRARTALDEGDAEAAMERAQDAVDYAEQAMAHAQNAIDAAEQSGSGTDRTGGDG